jgi:hypothetical protein
VFLLRYKSTRGLRFDLIHLTFYPDLDHPQLSTPTPTPPPTPISLRLRPNPNIFEEDLSLTLVLELVVFVVAETSYFAWIRSLLLHFQGAMEFLPQSPNVPCFFPFPRMCYLPLVSTFYLNALCMIVLVDLVDTRGKCHAQYHR